MSSRTYWEEARENGQRAVDYAERMLGGKQPGEIGAVPLAMTTEIEACGSADYPDVPLEALGERPVIHYDDRHRRMEEDFNALVAIEVAAGRVNEDVAMRAAANFHDYARATNLFPPNTHPQTSPGFYL
jgi:hypothetical protein